MAFLNDSRKLSAAGAADGFSPRETAHSNQAWSRSRESIAGSEAVAGLLAASRAKFRPNRAAGAVSVYNAGIWNAVPLLGAVSLRFAGSQRLEKTPRVGFESAGPVP